MLFAAIKLFVNFDFSVIMDKNQERSRAMRILMIEDEKLLVIRSQEVYAGKGMRWIYAMTAVRPWSI